MSGMMRALAPGLQTQRCHKFVCGLLHPREHVEGQKY